MPLCLSTYGSSQSQKIVTTLRLSHIVTEFLLKIQIKFFLFDSSEKTDHCLLHASLIPGINPYLCMYVQLYQYFLFLFWSHLPFFLELCWHSIHCIIEGKNRRDCGRNMIFSINGFLFYLIALRSINMLMCFKHLLKHCS